MSNPHDKSPTFLVTESEQLLLPMHQRFLCVLKCASQVTSFQTQTFLHLIVENLWIFRHPPSGYGEEPLSPQRKEEDTNCTLAQLQLPRQITLHAVVVPGFPKKVWREQCAHLIEDHHLARQSNEYVVNPEGKSLSVVVRYFDEAVVERAMTVLQKMPYNITAKEATKLALTSFKAEGLDDKVHKQLQFHDNK